MFLKAVGNNISGYSLSLEWLNGKSR
jgi:hypothetical protein